MIEREIKGVKRSFEFGTHTFRVIAQDTGMTAMQDIFDRIGKVDVPFWVSVFFATAKTACWLDKTKVDFTEDDVYLWVDEISINELESILAQLIDAYKTKNIKAPTTGLAENQ
jgi:hypothetical protein